MFRGRHVVKIDAKNRKAATGLVSLFVERERYRDAIEFAERNLLDSPSNREMRVLLGAAHRGRGDLEEAIEALESADIETTGDVDELTLLALLYQENDRGEDAIDLYQSAIEADESAPLPHLNLGLALFQEERYADAAVELERAVELDGESAFAHYSLGILYMDYIDQRQDAIEHFKEYQRLGGDDERVSDWLDRNDR